MYYVENENKQINKYVKILVMLFVIIIACNGSSIVAEINEGYATESVTGTWLNNIAESSVLINPIGTLFLWIGGFIQWALTSMAVAVSGQESTVMPWADAILFNAVPVLDVNFISPNSASLMSNLTKIIRTMYYTIFLISLAFFSVTVLIMAIKLATESIAAQQARYKEALARWGVALLLLFMVHFIMSFVFFLNENLVKIAAEICTKALESDQPILQSNVYYELLKKHANEHLGNEHKDSTIKKNIETNPTFFSTLASEGKPVMRDLFWFESYDTYMTFVNSENTFAEANKKEAIYRMYAFYILVAKINEKGGLTEEEVKKNKNPDIEVRKQFLREIIPKYTKDTILSDDDVNKLLDRIDANSIPFIHYNGDGYIDHRNVETLSDIIIKYSEFYNDIYGDRMGPYAREDVSIHANNAKKTPITQMSKYFRQNAYTPESVNTYSRTNINLPNCIMYCIFVFQSLFFFLAYMKRLFYVVILALLAPAIIVWDFVNGI